YKAYMKLSSDNKLTILGFEEDVAPAIQNFSSQKNNKHKVQSVVLDHFYDNLVKIIDDVDIVYLASKIPEAEKIKVYQLVTKQE
ncbi:sugar transferase, partial [Enterococcus sp. S181_ASV_20]|nr:sugar transferase [Enterococcus sp. S181_ASV_20]